MQWPLLPKFVDIYYHLAVVKGFSVAGGWTALDTWEFAPTGRAHLYPPFLHILLLIPFRLGVDPIALGRAVDVVSYPALLISFWFLVRLHEGDRKAFWATLLFSSVYSAFLSSVTLSAFNLAMIGVLWTIYLVSSNRTLAAGLVAAAVCYTHTMAAGMLGGMLLMAALFDPVLRKKVLSVIGVAVLLGAPMLIWQVLNAGTFALISAGENRLVEFDPFLYGLAAVRIFRCARKGRLDKWPLILFLGLAPVIPFRQARVIGGYGVLAAAWLASLEVLSWLDALGKRRGRSVAVGCGVLAAFFFMFLAPTCLWNLKEHRFKFQPADRTLVRYVMPDGVRDFRAKGFSIYFEKEYQQILDVLLAHTKPNETFWTDFPHAGGILYLKSGRSMSTAMMGEVGAWEDRQARLKNAKLLIWFKTAEGKVAPEIPGLVQSMGLRLVAETDLATIFENPTGGSLSHQPKAVIPIAALWSVLAVWMVGLAWSVRRRPSSVY